MKTRLFSLLLVVALIVTVSVFAVEAEDIDFSAGGTVSAVCQHCKGNAVEWLPWTGSETNGHYYVPEGISLGSTVTFGADDELCLHLNGQEITRGTSNRVFDLEGGNNTLNIMDHAANEGIISATGANNAGAVIRSRKAGDVINMYGGQIVQTPKASGTTAGAVCLYAGSDFYMYGGTIQGSKSNHGTYIGGSVYLAESGTTFTLDGGTIRGGESSTGGNVYIKTGAKFIMLSGTVTGGTSTSYGGNFYVNDADSELDIQGGTVELGHAPAHGANIASKGTVKLSGTGIIRNGDLTATGKYGSNLYVMTGSSFEMSGGSISCVADTGSTHGGNIYLYDGEMEMTGGTITGAATDGGSITAHTGSTVTLKGGTIQNGHTSASGGNIRVRGDSTLELPAGSTATISGGVAAEFGGNVYQESGTVNMYGGTIKNGTTVGSEDVTKNANGGNVYITEGYTMTMTGGTISGGNAGNEGGETEISASSGGNVYVGGTLELQDGTISAGKATNFGGNVATLTANATFNMSGGVLNGATGAGNGRNYGAWDGTANLSGGEIKNGKTPTRNSVVLSYNNESKTTISGDIVIDQLMLDSNTKYDSENDVWTTSDNDFADVTIAADFEGSVAFDWEHDSLDPAGHDTNAYVAGTVYSAPESTISVAAGYANTGAIYVLNTEDVGVLVTFDGTDLKVVGYTMVTASGETVISDLSELTDGAYLKLQGTGEITLVADTYVDLNGMDATITTGGHKLYLMDSTSDEFETAKGSVTGYGAEDLVIDVTNPVNGNRYITVDANDEQATAHRLELRISSINVRPSANGIYYTSTINCDDILEGYVQSYGVAVSLADMPNENYLNDGETMYTYIDVENSSFQSGKYNSGLIANIMENEGGATPIYANAYVDFLFADGDLSVMAKQGVAEDTTEGANVVAYSMQTVMQAINGAFTTYNAENQGKIYSFYDTWSDAMSGWGLNNISAYNAA